MEPYRLEALAELRRREEADRQRALTEATAGVGAASAALADAHARLADTRMARAEVRTRGLVRATSGAAQVGDLATGARYEERLAVAERHALREVRDAEARLAAAAAGEEAARDALAAAVRARQAVAGHEERWQEERAREREQREERLK